MSETQVTADDGTARLAYRGEVAGSDHIDAWIDLNGDEQLDADEPTDRATVTWEPVTAIALVSFTAQRQGDDVRLAWETAVEIDNAGFYLYRSAAPTGPLVRVNEQLIGAQGNAGGFTYDFVDVSPGDENSVRFYYTLEDVDFYGESTRHGPVVVQMQAVEMVAGRTLFLPLVRGN